MADPSVPDVLVVGIATVDAVAEGVEGFPPPGGLRFFDRLRFTTGGCAVNAAVALSRLGVRCSLVTRAGDDLLGRYLREELAREGVDARAIVTDASAPTPFTFVSVGTGGERSFLHVPGTNARLGADDIDPALLVGRRFVLVAGAMLMDSFDGEPMGRFLSAARRAGAATILDTVFVDGMPREEWERRVHPCLPHLDWFVPSLPEARALSGLDRPRDMARSFQDLGCLNVVVKLGSGGVFCLEGGGRESVVPAYPIEHVIDTTGAGDCWCAGFVAGLRSGEPAAASARLGCAVAAFGIQAAGATTNVPSLAAVRSFMACSGMES
jgi:sugar/nucleoside kinase (ribokinase family)